MRKYWMESEYLILCSNNPADSFNSATPHEGPDGLLVEPEPNWEISVSFEYVFIQILSDLLTWVVIPILPKLDKLLS